MKEIRERPGSEREEDLYNHFKCRRLDCLANEVPISLRATKYELYIHLSHSMLAGGEIAGAALMHISYAASLDHFIYHCDPSTLTVSHVFLSREPLHNGFELAHLTDPVARRKGGFIEHEPQLRRSGLGPDGHTVLCFFPPAENNLVDSLDECSTSDSVCETQIESCVLFFFKSKILDKAEGLYLDAGSDEEGLPSLQTALEQLFARRVFPCIDLPVMKAQFIAHFFLWKEDQHQVHTTTPMADLRPMSACEQRMLCEAFGIENKSSGEAQMLMQSHYPTIDIPPYSFSFLYGDFLPLQCHSLNDPQFDLTLLLPVRRLNEITNLEDTTRVVMLWASLSLSFLRHNFFNDIEQISPTLSKLLLVPLRTQRGLGLENHGAITLKDEFCLASAKDAEVSRLARVARLVIHELCHQWIGNRFTPVEISDIWLKEGLTRFLEFAILGHLLEAQGDELAVEYIANIFLYDIKLDSLLVDSMDSNALLGMGIPNHPVQPPEARLRRTDLMTLFDSITYNKAAAVLAMWDALFSCCCPETKVTNSPPAPPSRTDRFVPLEESLWCRALQKTLLKERSGLLRWAAICDEADCIRAQRAPLKSVESHQPLRMTLLNSDATELPRLSHRDVQSLLTPWLTEIGHPHVKWTCDNDNGSCVEVRLHQSSSQVSLADCWEAKSLRPRCVSLCRQYESLWTIPICLGVCLENAATGSKVYIQEYILMDQEELTLRLDVVDATSSIISEVSVTDPAAWLGFCVMSGPSNALPSVWKKSALTEVWDAISRGFGLAAAVSCRRSLVGISIRNMFQPKFRTDETQRRLSIADPNYPLDNAHAKAREDLPRGRRCDDEFEVHASHLAGPEPLVQALETWHRQLYAAAADTNGFCGHLTRVILRHLINLQQKDLNPPEDEQCTQLTQALRESFTMLPSEDNGEGCLHGIESCVNSLWSIGITGGVPAALQQMSESSA